MKMLRKLIVTAVCAAMLLTMLTSFAFADNLGKIVSISISVMPKTEFLVGEEFMAEGGVLTAVYENGSVDIPLTDPSIELKAPNLSRAGSKNVQLKFEGKKESYKVEVSLPGMDFTFDLNDGTSEPIVQNISTGSIVKRIADPSRDGYSFYNWYDDAACTKLHDFRAPIEEETTIYALWLENNTQYHTVTFDMNYYGCKYPTSEELVADGEQVRLPAEAPVRGDYAFASWTVDAEGTQAFDAAASVSADMTLYAQWEKTKTASSLYVFEAEDVDLSTKAGPGYSGENAGSTMVVTNKVVEASQDMFVAYQCKNGNSLEFYLASDSDAAANLVVRFAAEFSSMVINSDKYQVIVNGESVQYPDVYLTLEDGSQQGLFMDIDLHEIQLVKGSNLIQLKTTNDEALGGTLTATAPIIDCIKVETEAVVTWDGVYGLPAINY